MASQNALTASLVVTACRKTSNAKTEMYRVISAKLKSDKNSRLTHIGKPNQSLVVFCGAGQMGHHFYHWYTLLGYVSPANQTDANSDFLGVSCGI